MNKTTPTPARLSAVCEDQLPWEPKARTRKDEDYLCLVTHLGAFAFKDREEQTYYCRRYHELPKHHRDRFHNVHLEKSLKERIKIAMAQVEEENKLKNRAATLKMHAEQRKVSRQWLIDLCSELDNLCTPTAADVLVQRRRSEIMAALKDPQTSAATREILRQEARTYATESAARYFSDIDTAMQKALRASGSKEEVAKIMGPHLAWIKFQSARLMSIKVAAMPQVPDLSGRDVLLETERNTYRKASQGCRDIENRSAHF